MLDPTYRRFEWTGTPHPDGLVLPVIARITDQRGLSATASANIVIDLVPPSIFTMTPSAREGAAAPLPVAVNDVIRFNAPILVLDWTAASDGSGVAGYLAGWTNSPLPDASALTFVPAASQRHLEQPVNEARVYYAHVGARDNHGNVQWLSFGPVFVDKPTTPDLIRDPAQHVWMNSGASLVSADSTLALRESSALTQLLHTSWDTDTLRVAWTGADWSTQGDAFIYFDNAAGGATQVFDPYASGAQIAMPTGFAPETLAWIKDNSRAELWRWNGSAWVKDRDLSTAEYHYTTSTGKPVADLLLPFTVLNATPAGALRMLALASEEGVLRLWASAPDRNPLNSARVINPQLAGAPPLQFALTQFLSFPSLGAGGLPNGGRLPGSHVLMNITPEPDSTALTYLNDGHYATLPQGGSLDADHNGVLDVAAGLATPRIVAPNAALRYTVTLFNAGHTAATAVQLNAQALGALRLAGGASSASLPLGDLAPGQTLTVVIDGSAQAAGNASELIAALQDARHRDYDWGWALHAVDRAAPSDIVITKPTGWVRAAAYTIVGNAIDASGVPTVEVEITPLPAGATVTLICADATPDDGVWSCPWNIASISGLTGFDLRARAIDRFGNVSAFSPPHHVDADGIPPTTQLNAIIAQYLADGYLNAAELAWLGGVLDNLESVRGQICLTPEFGGCRDASVLGAGPRIGWDYDLSSALSGDGIPTSLRLYGFDAAGNRSDPNDRAFIVDTVPPVITVNPAPALARADANVTSPLAGTVTDGGGVATLVAIALAPDGTLSTHAVTVTDGGWKLDLGTLSDGVYQVQLQATDRAGNASASIAYRVTVSASPGAVTLSRFVVTPAAGGGARISWRTLRERDTAGFYLLRERGSTNAITPSADATRVGSGLVLAVGGGGNYAVVDRDVTSATRYTYWLVEVETDGDQNIYGPATFDGLYRVALPVVQIE